MGVDKDTNKKFEELEREPKQIKETDFLGSVNFNDLGILVLILNSALN